MECITVLTAKIVLQEFCLLNDNIISVIVLFVLMSLGCLSYVIHILPTISLP